MGVESPHPFHLKSIETILKEDKAMDVFFSVYGGITSAGRLPDKYVNSKTTWWLGIETTHGGDLMPFLKLQEDPDMNKAISGQTYKDFSFIRRETNTLAKYVSRIT